MPTSNMYVKQLNTVRCSKTPIMNQTNRSDVFELNLKTVKKPANTGNILNLNRNGKHLAKKSA